MLRKSCQTANKMFQCGKDIGVAKPYFIDFLAVVSPSSLFPSIFLFNSTSPYKEFVKQKTIHPTAEQSYLFLFKDLLLCRLDTDEFSFSVSWSLN